MLFHIVFILVLPKGFEPLLSGLEPPVLPLHQRRLLLVASTGFEPILKVPKTFVLTITL